jgi:hypothetical protein
MICHSERSEESLYAAVERSLRGAQGRLFAALRACPERSEGMTRLVALLLLAACASPEAGRAPGHPGADLKNWGQPVEIHAGAQPYYETPCATERVECHGPPAVFGPTPPPD